MIRDIQRPARKPTPAKAAPQRENVRLRIVIKFNWPPKFFFVLKRRPRITAVVALAVTAVLIGTSFIDIFRRDLHELSYNLTASEQELVGKPNGAYADRLVYDEKEAKFMYNHDYQVPAGVRGVVGGPRFSADFNADARKGVHINDPATNTSITLKPLFDMGRPRKNKNQLMYRMEDLPAKKIYTLGVTGFKEDVIVDRYTADTLSFEYEVSLPEGTEARVEPDGSLSVYGADAVLLGNVATATPQDADLLKKARNNTQKTNRLFSLPAPYAKELGKSRSDVKVTYKMSGKQLTVKAEGLKGATYPLSIDPSVYIESAVKLMRGNNETNIDFNVANELIQKGSTTGARFNEWKDTMDLNETRWDQGVAVAGGYIYSAGGTKSNLTSVSYDTAGSDTFVVPAGITSISVKMWGGGGGGGGGGTNGAGGDGGGAGYAAATLSVSSGESLAVNVGGGGGPGNFSSGTSGSSSGDGGGGGGYSEINRSGTTLLLASGGGGGGGGDNSSSTPGGQGGAGGGTTGTAGGDSGNANGGGGGTQAAGGSGGNGGSNTGVQGFDYDGGDGADGRSNQGSDGSVDNNGLTTGGDGGAGDFNSNGFGAGGGGGSGIFGGGGGSSSASGNAGGGGGGGGASYTTGTSTTTQNGNANQPGNSGDSARGSAGEGGDGGATTDPGTSGTDGKVVITYSTGGSGNEVRSEVYWARLNTTTGAIESTSPGTQSCIDWCANSAYNLPDERAGLSLVAYSGFLYAIGGVDQSGARSNHVYIAKLGANGEPSRWHPTSTDKDDWVYWYRDTGTNLSSERSYAGAVAYNNRLYIMGGQTNASSGGVNTVEVADLNPTGLPGSWSTTGMSALPSVRHNFTALTYNDRLYVIGGNSNGSLQDTVHYTRLASDGTMSGWKAANTFTTGRMTGGGNYATIWGGYLYLMGGCTALTNGYCSTIGSDIQLASINADGSLGSWGSILGLTNQRMGYGLVAWRNNLYRLGGCTSQDTGSGVCTAVTANASHSTINQDGDASTVNNSVPSGTAPCSGATPTNCDIPPAGDSAGQGGRLASGVVVNNGYIYIIGGCQSNSASNSCSAGMSGNTSYASIGSDGTITSPASCSGTSYGSWCVNSTNRINGTSGIGTMGVAVFNNVIYAIGGTNGSSWQSTVYRVSLNEDGSLAGNWSTQSFFSVGMGSARGYSYVFTRANPASAGSNPGNLYVVGGCSGGGGIGCSTYFTQVYKCNISTSGSLNGCSTSNQLQLDSEPGTGGNQGLGLMAGTLYANYIYLLGGSSPNESERGSVMYARIDSSNNIVAVTGSIWVTSPNTIEPIRRRGIAFGYNGYLYSLAGYNPSDSLLNDLLFAKIDVSDGSISTFQTSQVTVTARWDLRAVVSNGYVYAIGGCSTGSAPGGCSATESSIQTFQLYNNDSGAPAQYDTSANLFGTDRMGASSAILNGYLYIAGGCSSTTDCTNAINNVRFAPIDAHGDVGAWNNVDAANLPAARTWGQLEVAGGSLYFIGGQPDNPSNERPDVYYTTPNSDGSITSWSAATNELPEGRTQHSATVWNNRIYVTGGYNTSGNPTTTIYVSPQLNNGGDITSAWTTTTSFNVARTGHTSIAYANNLYTLGGYDGSNYLNDVQYTKINSDGTLAGTWTDTTSLPTPIRQGDGFAANGYMYLIGGRSSNTSCNSNTLVAPISANTAISSGNNPTGIGEWYETNAKYSGSRYGATVSYYDGKAYVLGGACNNAGTLAYTAADRVVQTTLLSQAQVAKYSRMIDADSNVFPNRWLINGLDNSIGARWKFRYRSSTAESAAWGQETNFGTVTLGQPETYIPLDGSGANTNFARYFYLYVTIDSSQAYGYPDDVTRGPTITDATLFYTSDPSKRMRHGKTFIDGQQQPLDTPIP